MIKNHEGLSYVTGDGVKVKKWTAEEKEQFELGVKEYGKGIGGASQSMYSARIMHMISNGRRRGAS
jgi:hypothetical protein